MDSNRPIPSNSFQIEHFNNGRESAVVQANRFLDKLGPDGVKNVFSLGNSICVVYRKDRLMK